MTARSAFVSSTSPLLVTLAGSSTAVPALRTNGYTPILNDRVAVIAIDDTKLLVLGKVS